MRSLGAGLLSHYQGVKHTVAYCVKMTRKDSTVVAFTEHDRDLVVSGTTYRAAVGCQLSALRFASVIDRDTFVVEGLIAGLSTSVEEPDTIVGLYSNALVEVLEVNWQDTTQIRPVKRGRVAQVSPKGMFYSMEVESLSSILLRSNLVESYTADCAADFGDTRCGVTPTSQAGTITGVTDAVTLVASGFAGPGTAGYYSFGKLVINSIPWAINQIKEYNHGTKTFTLALPLPLVDGAPQVGDTFTAYQGCDRKYTTCRDTHSNVEKFRGFPFMPNQSALRKVPNVVPGLGYVAGD